MLYCELNVYPCPCPSVHAQCMRIFVSMLLGFFLFVFLLRNVCCCFLLCNRKFTIIKLFCSFESETCYVVGASRFNRTNGFVRAVVTFCRGLEVFEGKIALINILLNCCIKFEISLVNSIF